MFESRNSWLVLRAGLHLTPSSTILIFSKRSQGQLRVRRWRCGGLAELLPSLSKHSWKLLQHGRQNTSTIVPRRRLSPRLYNVIYFTGPKLTHERGSSLHLASYICLPSSNISSCNYEGQTRYKSLARGLKRHLLGRTPAGSHSASFYCCSFRQRGTRRGWLSKGKGRWEKWMGRW